MTQHELELDHGAPDHDRMRAFEVDRTPFPVALQCAQAIFKFRDTRTSVPVPRVLDPSAGDGVWCAAIRKTLPEARVIGVEPRPEDQASLRRFAQPFELSFESFFDYWTGRALFGVEGCCPFDIIITNPPFSRWTPWHPTLIEMLSPFGILALYGPSLWGHSDEPAEGGGDPAVASVFERHPPLAQFRIHGRVRHRYGRNPKNGKPYSTDSRKYSLWVWGKEPGSGTWRCSNLPKLTTEEKTLRPGQMDEVAKWLA